MISEDAGFEMIRVSDEHKFLLKTTSPRVRGECNKTTVFNFFFVFYLCLIVPRECLEYYIHTHIKTPNIDLTEVMLES